LSLAGVQEKIALYRNDQGQWCAPLNGAVTSHILKQATVRFPNLLENELYCMTLAEPVGIEVPRVDLVAADIRILSVERFDRIRPSGGPHPRVKLHQEDFCQALSVDPAHKYEQDGGPGIRRCARVVREHCAIPIVELRRLVQWVAFNYLIGNEDAHAKNLGLLYTPQGIRLTPFYDLVSTELYSDLERRLAMKIGRSWDVRNVQRSDWQRLAADVDLPWRAVRALLQELGERASQALGETVSACAERFGPSPVYEQLRALVTRRLGRLTAALSHGRL
jgi:serine/threonine-protein kinase HipA